jgi:hypothetical protein
MIKICECCGDCMFDFAKKPIEEIINGTNNPGLKNIISSKTIRELNSDGKELVELCVDFLLFQRDCRIKFPKKNQNLCHRDKYITIWSFVYDFLKIEKDSNYDYWLLCFLQTNNILEHGIAIRCGWFYDNHKNPYFDRKLTEDRKLKFIEWGNNAADYI